MNAASLYKDASYYFPLNNRVNLLNLNGLTWAIDSEEMTEVSGVNDIALQGTSNSKFATLLARDQGCPSNPDLCFGVTVAFWFKYTFKFQNNGDQVDQYFLTTGGMHTNYGIGFEISERGIDRNEELRFVVRKSDSQCIFETKFPILIWMHVTFTWDGNELVIFRNGDKITDFEWHECEAGSFGTFTADNFTRIGIEQANAAYDEFALWDIVLPEQHLREIVTFYEGTFQERL